MMILVTGGASCGKSAYAEELACALPGDRYYLAAMKPFGEEGARRVARHRAMRAGKGFTTIECYDGLKELAVPDCGNEADQRSATQRTTALLESMGNVVANELFSEDGTWLPAEEALQAVVDGVGYVAGLFDNLVIVGDEFGSDGIRYDEATEAYIWIGGSAACALAARCDIVVECVAGQPSVIKGADALAQLKGCVL